MEDQEKKWYVVHILSGHEKKVKSYIESEVARLDLGEKISKIAKIKTPKIILPLVGLKNSFNLFFIFMSPPNKVLQYPSIHHFGFWILEYNFQYWKSCSLYKQIWIHLLQERYFQMNKHYFDL